MRQLNKARVIISADDYRHAVHVRNALEEAGVITHGIALATTSCTHEKLQQFRPDIHIKVRDRSEFLDR
jgi:hypothetical protein